MDIPIEPIGYVQIKVKDIPHYWMDSEARGYLVIDENYQKGLDGLLTGQNIFVIFQFHLSPLFRADQIMQTPRDKHFKKGVFATSSPIRPNPLGLSTLKILDITTRHIHVIGLDMIDGTPILDIKPCPDDKNTA